jgi:hypothetical protein
MMTQSSTLIKTLPQVEVSEHFQQITIANGVSIYSTIAVPVSSPYKHSMATSYQLSSFFHCWREPIFEYQLLAAIALDGQFGIW